MVEQVDKELKDADAQLKQAQEQLEYVIITTLKHSKPFCTFKDILLLRTLSK